LHLYKFFHKYYLLFTSLQHKTFFYKTLFHKNCKVEATIITQFLPPWIFQEFLEKNVFKIILKKNIQRKEYFKNKIQFQVEIRQEFNLYLVRKSCGYVILIGKNGISGLKSVIIENIKWPMTKKKGDKVWKLNSFN
jgi:replication initiation and membrane attachment protein DnaB